MIRRGIVRINHVAVGEIMEDEEGYLFTYDSEYRALPRPIAVSLTLPVRAEPYRSDQLFPFFAGLLAEGSLATVQCQSLRLDERDRFGRLLETCRDAVGAVTVDPAL
jgi:serine/threonine-protein kinase HipA